ncbi:MAG: hypothetical protein U9N33_07380 [Campylobacterota bacterium]|nr:hypothetical protein [Campylobacterota bacterium]
MEFFNKNKILIFRSFGAVMLLVGFAIHFWVTPKEVLTQNDIAAANVARMEAKVAGGSTRLKGSAKKDHNKYLDTLKNTQAKQMQYLTIIAMVLGVGFLGYSFMPKKLDS